jgi:hypothetical protein
MRLSCTAVSVSQCREVKGVPSRATPNRRQRFRHFVRFMPLKTVDVVNRGWHRLGGAVTVAGARIAHEGVVRVRG